MKPPLASVCEIASFSTALPTNLAKSIISKLGKPTQFQSVERFSRATSYSRYCFLYRNWEGRLPVTMRQTHLGGDRLFVDYAG
ncbi:MAG TPA: hypothetical protein VGC26_00845, partial [Afipia sp.]